VSSLYWVVLGSAVLSGFFSLTAFALRSFRKVGLEEAFGPDNHQELAYLDRDLSALRLTAGLCRMISNLVLVVSLAWILQATRTFLRATATVALSGTIIAIFSIAIPNAWAAHAGEKVLSVTLRVLVLFRYLLYPLIVVMQSLDLPIRRLAGITDTEQHNDEQTKQEIIQVATEGQAEGTVEPEEVQMIESVMEFGETQAAEIMTPRTDIFALPIDTPWDEAVSKVVEAGHTRVPVYEESMDRIVGVLYAKDMLKDVSGSHPTGIRGMLRKCYFVPETKPLDELLKEFKKRKVHLAIVLDEYGGTAGLVSIEDVVEEIVGDIADEYDETAPAGLKRIGDRSAEIDGRFYVDELNDEMGLELPEDEDYDTVAGLVFSQLGYIPKKGETLETRGAKFTVLAADERKITRLRVDLLKDTGSKK